MEFTYNGYQVLLQSLNKRGYRFWNYHSFPQSPRSVILRHDIDNSLEQAVRLAELEAAEGVYSTYFVLLRTDFYNPASKSGLAALRRIQALGHEIGLHFDEAAYGVEEQKDIVQNITKECGILSALLETQVSSVSMHRPSKATLEADLQIPDVVNSYSKAFFQDFKYLSDSRRRWREPVLDIIESGAYDRLHILTHPFWYHETEQSIQETVSAFVRSANEERWRQMAENITDMDSILKEDEL
ncbi:MAG: hypothetical protein HFF84_08835 [Oscillibacter sp.]|nr:hypothetical protein [Oscillibacter sp.]